MICRSAFSKGVCTIIVGICNAVGFSLLHNVSKPHKSRFIITVYQENFVLQCVTLLTCPGKQCADFAPEHLAEAPAEPECRIHFEKKMDRVCN